MLLRLVVALLAVAAPALSGCKDNATEEYNKKLKAHEDEYKVIDDGLIRAYLTRKNITEGTGEGQYTRLNEPGSEGLYIVRLSDGPAGAREIKIGNQVEVKYIGRYLRATNETTVFDNSTDKRIPCGCITVTMGASGLIIGQDQGIAGWYQGLLKMKQGDRRLLLVPSYLGFGPSGRGTVPGDEPLLFDMEVLNVK